MNKYTSIILTLFLVHLSGFAQTHNYLQTHYYGNKAELGELEILNDSLYRVSFFFLGVGHQEYDTGYYYIRKDTLFLCSVEKTPFEPIMEYGVKSDYLDNIARYDNLVFTREYLVKKYHQYYKYSFFQKITSPIVKHKHYKSKDKYYSLLNEDFYNVGFDTINKVLVIPFSSERGDIIVIKSKDGFYRRIVLTDDTNPLTFIRIIDTYPYRVYLDNFPLLIRKDKLIPCNNDANRLCLIENGFVFPEMDTTTPTNDVFRHSRYYYYAPYRGLIGFTFFHYGRIQKL